MKDVTKLSIVELKSLAYDELRNKEITERNIKVLVGEIDRKEALEAKKASAETKKSKNKKKNSKEEEPKKE